MDEFEYTTFEDAYNAIELAANDAVGENPDVGHDDAAHDIAISMMSQFPPLVRYEIAQSYLGWDPEEDADLFLRNNIRYDPLEVESMRRGFRPIFAKDMRSGMTALFIRTMFGFPMSEQLHEAVVYEVVLNVEEYQGKPYIASVTIVHSGGVAEEDEEVEVWVKDG